MKRILCVLIIISSAMNTFSQKEINFEDFVRQAVERQLNDYPLSTLKDLYKSFFQDVFGPGHMINDTTAAKNYLLRELSSYGDTQGIIAEPTGYKHNFYRVNLSVIKHNIIPFDTFLEAFLDSASDIKPVNLEEWIPEWSRIKAVISSMELDLLNFHTDDKEINFMLEKGEYVGHHSDTYSKEYDPHYRIISSRIFKEKILPLI